MKTFNKNIILLAVVIILFVSPFFITKNAEFGGADGAAKDAITEIDPNYKPWFNSIFEPASGEIESLLFALQAAIGAGIVCYYFGYMKGRRKGAYNR